jgi:hypothetical protein
MTDWKSRLERILPRVERPGRYVGGEVNAVRKDWDATPTRVALIFPDLHRPPTTWACPTWASRSSTTS